MTAPQADAPNIYDQLLTEAKALSAADQHDDALSLLQQLLDKATSQFGERSFIHSLIFSTMADIAFRGGLMDKAEHYNRGALACMDADGFDKTPEYLLLHGNLIACLLKQGHHDKAEQAIERALALCAEMGDGALLYKAFTLSQRGELQKAQGENDLALETLLDAQALYHEIGQGDSFEAAQTAFEVGKIYFEQEDYKRAFARLKSALVTREKIYGALSLEAFDIREYVAFAALYSDIFGEAELANAWNGMTIKQVWGEDSPLLARIHHFLGKLYLRDGRILLAPDELEKAYTIALNGYGADHPMTQSIERDLSTAKERLAVALAPAPSASAKSWLSKLFAKLTGR